MNPRQSDRGSRGIGPPVQRGGDLGIRERLNRSPRITTVVTALVIVFALTTIIWQIFVANRPTKMSNKRFYSDDDGKTWFADDMKKIAPFDHNGKTAYVAYVWTCDGGKTGFVSHLERYTPEAKQKIKEFHDMSIPPTAMPPFIDMDGIEIKKPGTGDDPANWVLANGPQSMNFYNIKCPDGTQNNLQAMPPPP